MYSILDGYGTPMQYAERAKEMGFTHLALTDHGGVDGAITFQKACKENGIKSIIGCEGYIVPNLLEKEKGEKRYHITLLVQNQCGWENLLKLLTKANLNGFYYRPRFDPETLLQHCEGITVCSACASSFLHMKGGPELMVELSEKTDVAIELMPFTLPEQITTNLLSIEIANEFDLPVIATNDCHYPLAEHNKLQEVLLAMQSKTTWKDPNRWKFDVDDLYLKSADEMIESFSLQGIIPKDIVEAAIFNTMEIASKCDFEIKPSEPKLPSVYIKGLDDLTEEEQMFALVAEGLEKRAKDHKWIQDNIEQYEERVEEELAHIMPKFTRYFLIVYELLNWCEKQGIMSGPGRGCFLPNNKIVYSNGKIKCIKEINIGDEIINHLGETDIVEDKFSYDIDEEIIEIETETTTISCTVDHNILSPDGWKEAQEFKNGDKIVRCWGINSRKTQCDAEVVKKVRRKDYSGKVYDLQIKRRHTYNINGLAVHNSVGGSLVAYCLGITHVDPIKYDLVFSRFISPGRIDLPDIDMDFEDWRRDDVKKHLEETYGKWNVIEVSTFLKMHGRGALRDVGRVFDIPLYEVDKAAKCIVTRSGGDVRADFSIADAFETFEDGIKFKKKYPEVTDIAMKFEGHIKATGRHAAATCVSEHDLRMGKNANFVVRRGRNVCNWEKNDAEYMGLMKLDILGLNSLTILNKAKALIKERHGVDINYNLIDLDDEKLYEQFTAGNTIGIFQFNSNSMINLCREIHGENFDQVVAINALHRPGALRSGFTQIYRDRKFGKAEVEYIHPWIEGITKDTQGLIIYQEQAMRLMYELGGLTWKTADTIRKVISKSKGVEEFMKFEEDFVSGCERLGTLSATEARVVFGELKNMGCLDGETLIARVGKNDTTGNTIKIKHLYELNKNKSDSWKKKFGGITILSMHEDGFVRKNKIKDVFKTGKKIVYYVVTESGKAIKATGDHRFLTIDGWKILDEINTGDLIKVSELLVPSNKSKSGVGKGSHGKICPRKRKGAGQTVEEKEQKNKLMKKYNGRCQICGIKKNVDMHHIDEDHSNNSDENTMLLCRKHHKAQHDPDASSNFKNGYYTSFEAIKIKTKIGERETYDIEMVDEPRNYVANNFIVHNSYSFNKAHAVEYSMIAVWQMYLKVYYPIEFMATLLSYGPATKKHELINEAKRLGIKILLPDINSSDSNEWIILGESNILAPFREVKGIGEVAAEKIVENRAIAGPFSGPDDLEKRVEKRKVNKKVRDLLIKVKAYDTSEDKLNVSEEELEELSQYFDFELSNDPLYKWRGIIDRIKDKINILNLSEAEKIDGEEFFFGRMETLKVGYRAAVGTKEGKGGFGSLGGVYGNIKDDTAFKMLIFGTSIYLAKKEIVEHCEGDAVLTLASPTDDKAALKTQSAWFGGELLSGEVEELEISLIEDYEQSEDMALLKNDMSVCSACEFGDQNAPIATRPGLFNLMVVGEAPSKNERGVFSSRANQILINRLEKSGFDKEMFHWSNIIKCNVQKANQIKAKHIKECGWLEKEIELIKPLIILSLGNTGNMFFRGEKSGIMAINATTAWNQKYNCWVTYSISPSMVAYEEANMPLLDASINEFTRKISLML
jgi:uracil-DNA glycosylase family 4